MSCGRHEDDLDGAGDAAEQSGCTGGGAGACGSSNCQQPPQTQQQQAGSFGSWIRRHGAADASTSAQQRQPEPEQQQQPGLGTCKKCKQEPAVVLIRQNEPYCNACLEAGVQQRVRVATKGRGLIQPGDSVALALSGGAASTALLACLADMRSPEGCCRPERGKVAFRLALLHIDTSAVCALLGATGPDEQQQQPLEVVQAAAAALGLSQQLLVLRLQAIFLDRAQLQQRLEQQQQQQQQQQLAPPAADAGQAQNAAVATGAGCCQGSSSADACQLQQQLVDLVSSVGDATGREDLVMHLTQQLLLRAAAARGCSRLLLGDCASRVAARVIADAAKGRGFSLPGDIQPLDARLLPGGGPCLLLPLREVTHKEVQQLCRHKGLPWADRQPGQPMLRVQVAAAGGGSRAGTAHSAAAAKTVNTLVEGFVAEMEAGLPASIYTIIKTAAHLQPFPFNDVAAVPEAADFLVPPNVRAQRQQRQQQQQCNGVEDSRGGLQLCAVCGAPLPAAAAAGGLGAAASEEEAAAAVARLTLAGLTGRHSSRLCYSCNRQILYQVQVPPQNTGPGATLEAKLQRLRQLLPPGMLLEDEDDA